MNHLKVKGPRKSLGAYIAGPYQFREIFKNLREKNYAVENKTYQFREILKKLRKKIMQWKMN